MTAEAQRIAIAEACGWTDVRHESNYFVGRSTPRSTLRGNNHKGNRWEIPSYPTDLNACHEFEKMIGAKWPTYCEILLRIVEPEPRTLEVCHYWNLLHATAAQRCEAFLKTIGKWEVQHDR